MKVKYDSKIDAMYIEFAQGRYDRTRKISDNVLVDEDRSGKVLGVEILDAKETIPAFKPQKSKFQFQIT